MRRLFVFYCRRLDYGMVGCCVGVLLFTSVAIQPVGCSPSPLHDIVITNSVWCMAYQRQVEGGRGGGSILPDSRATVLQQCGQCRRAGRIKGRLSSAHTIRSRTISCKGQRSPGVNPYYILPPAYSTCRLLTRVNPLTLTLRVNPD